MAFFKSWFLIGVFVNVVAQMPGGSPRSSPGVAADKHIKQRELNETKILQIFNHNLSISVSSITLLHFPIL